MLPIEEYPEAIGTAKLSVLEINMDCRELQNKLDAIYTPTRYAAYVGSDLKSEAQRNAALDLNLLNNGEYQRLKIEEARLENKLQVAKIDLEKLQDEFLLLKLKLRTSIVSEA